MAINSRPNKARPLSDDEIKSIIFQEDSNADLFTSKVQEEREFALKYYRQDPYGNEQEGYSTVVASDVADTVEWIMPQVMEMFLQENAVEFSPRGSTNPEEAEFEIKQAKQETAYVGDVYFNQNNGFLNSYEFIKDALVQKNGVMKIFWDETIVNDREEYEALSNNEYMKMLSDDNIEIEEHSVFVGEEEVDTPEQALKEIEKYARENPNKQPPEMTHSVVLSRQNEAGKVSCVVVPPERFKVDKDHESLDLRHARYVSESYFMTQSELLELGFDPELVERAPSYSDINYEEETIVRYQDEGGFDKDDIESGDPSRREIQITEHFVRADRDGDGNAELLKVTMGGGTRSGIILDIEEVDSIPFISTAPIIQPHQYYGRSISDIVQDIQKIKTSLLRAGLDNLSLSNRPITYVNTNGKVNIDDLLTRRPGGIVRGKAPMMEAMGTYQTPVTAQHSFSAMQFIDDWREQKTGVSKVSQGLDPQALSQSTNLVGMSLMNTSMLKIKMIARIMAETGFKQIFLKIHELVMKYEKNKKVAQVTGEYIEVDPRSWRKRDTVTINVGVGNVSRQEQLLALQQVQTLQQTMVQFGGMGQLVTMDNIYRSTIDVAEKAGISNPQAYFTDPSTVPPPPEPEQPADSALEIASAQVAIDAQKASADFQLKVQEMENKYGLEEAKLALDALKAGVDINKVVREQSKLEIDENIQEPIQQTPTPRV